MRLTTRLALVCLVLSAPLAAQEPAGALPRLAAIDSAFSEVWRSEVPVAGGVRVGILAGPLDRAVRMDSLAVWLPSTEQNRLCVEIISRDGRYDAHLEYALAGQHSGIYLLDFPTRQGAILQAYRARELAVLAYVVTAGCKTRDKQYLIARWGDGPDFDQVTVFLNTGGLDTTMVLPSSNGDTRFSRCQSATGEMQRTAFDTECSFELLPGILGEKIKVRRKNYENRLRDVKLPLLLP